ncbi:hypothetical protein GYMLUDRAFT_161037 [Collybiopsis luxurians FD-317 M1]|nr:hypothetical protein GYMLUDRAFT_161037 [Collybiopsis luxurians FD-317 M1]
MSLKLHQQHRYRSYDDFLNNTYCDDHGKAVYKVHTPFALRGTTTISKALDYQPTVSPSPPSASHPSQAGDDDDVASLDSGSRRRSLSIHDSEEQPRETNPHADIGEAGADSSSQNFEYTAQIDWRIIRSPRIRFANGRYSGQEVLASDMFRKEGWGWWGRHRVFTGEDGKEYKWRLRSTYCELSINDTGKTPVAKYHAKAFSKDKPFLEIFPEGLHMLDEIFVTFMYVEQLRRVRETSSTSAAIAAS